MFYNLLFFLFWKLFEKKVLSFQFSLSDSFFYCLFRSFYTKKFMVMNSLFVHLRSVKEFIFSNYYFLGFIDFSIMPENSLNLFLVFNLRNKFLRRPEISSYSLKANGFVYYFKVEDFYERLNYFVTDIILVSLNEKLFNKCMVSFLPFRTNYELFSSIKNLFLNNQCFYNWILNLKFLLYFRFFSLNSSFFIDRNFTKTFLKYNNFKFFFPVFVFSNIFFRFYSLVFYGLVWT